MSEDTTSILSTDASPSNASPSDDPFAVFTSAPKSDDDVALNVMDMAAFGDIDINNLPEIKDGTYTFMGSDVRVFKLDARPDEEAAGITKYSMIVEFTLEDSESPFNGEVVSERIVIYPTANLNLPPKIVADIKESVRKLKRFLGKINYRVEGFTPAKFKRDMVGMYFDIEVKVNVKEDAVYKNIKDITLKTDFHPSNSAGSPITTF